MADTTSHKPSTCARALEFVMLELIYAYLKTLVFSNLSCLIALEESHKQMFGTLSMAMAANKPEGGESFSVC